MKLVKLPQPHQTI